MSLVTAKELLEAIVAYNKVKNGDSGDAEHDAGVELQNAAIAHVRAEAGGSIDLAELVDSYGDTLDEDVDEDDATS
jgi:hypothetical protein